MCQKKNRKLKTTETFSAHLKHENEILQEIKAAGGAGNTETNIRKRRLRSAWLKHEKGEALKR